jgi:hypothetical protein
VAFVSAQGTGRSWFMIRFSVCLAHTACGMRHALCDRTCTSQPEPGTMSAESILWINTIPTQRRARRQQCLPRADVVMAGRFHTAVTLFYNPFVPLDITNHTLASMRNQVTLRKSHQDLRNSIRIVGKGLILSVTIATTS